MKRFNNKIAAITGAGSGIGRAIAQELADHGCQLALSDVNQIGLEDTRLLLVNNYPSLNVKTYSLD
ncbi:MAG: NAD(P)-dependent dehydrogenase (short-subunit alcohol dehydrogenase family), partial [Bermanella sp.]